MSAAGRGGAAPTGQLAYGRVVTPGFVHDSNMQIEGRSVMEINKTKVVELLKRRGLNDRAEWVDRQLPARIDVYDNAGLLATLSIDPNELADDAPSDR